MDEDPETRAYRMKIEEQKIMREKILHIKEQRRKLAAQAEAKAAAAVVVVPPTEVLKQPEQPQPQKIPPATQIQHQNQQQHHPVKRTYNPNINTNPNIKVIATQSPQVIKKVALQQQNVLLKPTSGPLVVAAVAAPKKPENAAGINSFLNNRKVIVKDQSLPDTSVVVISNLAAGTSEVKLRKLCQTMGDIQVRVRI